MNKYSINQDTQMRDAVIDRLYDLSETDTDIMFLTADMGAKALDRWRQNRPNQYRDTGIAEQAMASVGAGMAKEGKKVFIYAIAPFVTTRIHEFHKLNTGVQKLPVHTLGMGAGFSYSDSGPTHYTTEDIALMRAIPHLTIFGPSDSLMAAKLVEKAYHLNTPTYHRLDRSNLPILTSEQDPLETGINELETGRDGLIFSTGNMVHESLKARDLLKKQGLDIGVADVYRLKPLNTTEVESLLNQHEYAFSVEEHLLAGGLGSILAELIVDKGLETKLKRIGIDDKLVYLYGRDNIHRNLGIDAKSIVNTVKERVKK